MSSIKSKWYDLVGQSGLPIVHPGGAKATRQLLDMCGVNQDKKVFDAGCGTGWTACEIAGSRGAIVVGIDLSETMIARARERAHQENLGDKIEFCVADIFRLPFRDEVFDAVIFESLLSIIPRKQGALREMTRLLRRGGRVGANEMFALPSTPPEILHPLMQTFFFAESMFTPTGLRDLFAETGLKVIEMTEKPSSEAYPIAGFMEVMGLSGVLKFLFTFPGMWWKLLRDPDLRAAEREDDLVSRIVFKQEKTRGFFGFALIVGQKRQ